MEWAVFAAALAHDEVAGMIGALAPLATAHAGTAPAASKLRAVKLVRAACLGNPGRQLRLGLALCGSDSLTGQELGAPGSGQGAGEPRAASWRIDVNARLVLRETGG